MERWGSKCSLQFCEHLSLIHLVHFVMFGKTLCVYVCDRPSLGCVWGYIGDGALQSVEFALNPQGLQRKPGQAVWH